MSSHIPLSVLFGDPERVVPSLSPDGRRIAWLAPVEGALNLYVDGAPVTSERRGIRQYWWSSGGSRLLWLRDEGGDENFHLVSLDLAKGDVSDLTPFAGTRCEVIALSRARPLALVGLNRRDPRRFDLHELDLESGRCGLVAENPGIEDWLVDPELNLVGAMRMRDDGRVEALALEKDGWRVVNGDIGDYLAALPYGVTASGDLLLRTDKTTTARALARLDVRTGELATEFHDPDYDIHSVVLHPATQEPQLAVVEREFPTTVVLDDTIAADWQQLEALHRGRPVILSRDLADNVWIVGYLSDSGPVAHYRWDRRLQQAEFLFDHRPEMHDFEWAPMEPFSFHARDGLKIEGYLSYPPSRPRQDLPAVVNVHGGPWRRNVWGFDPEAQWLADRGYVCIQVNYRGSAGYGQEFLDAGDKEWGAKMQDDLVDAVGHLAEQGVIDHDRVGIMGVSYGGYATLAAITFTGVFRCGVSRVGPANLVSFIQSLPSYWEPTVELWHRRVGHPERDRAALEAVSPLFHVDRIDRPLLLAHGARDPRVPRSESDSLSAALTARGVDHEYIVFEDEGHGINQAKNRTMFYERAEEFLHRHLM